MKMPAAPYDPANSGASILELHDQKCICVDELLRFQQKSGSRHIMDRQLMGCKPTILPQRSKSNTKSLSLAAISLLFREQNCRNCHSRSPSLYLRQWGRWCCVWVNTPQRKNAFALLYAKLIYSAWSTGADLPPRRASQGLSVEWHLYTVRRLLAKPAARHIAREWPQSPTIRLSDFGGCRP